MPQSSSASVPSSLLGELVAGAIGAGVAIACLLPPIVHLVSGPLGPAIGGFVGSSRVSATVRARIIVAVTIATTFAGAVATLLGVAAHLASPGELPSFVPTAPAGIAAAAGVVWMYAVTVAFVGTVVRGAADQKEAAQPEASDASGASNG